MTGSVDYDGLLDCAVRAARVAGDHARNNADRRHMVAQRFEHDVKLHLDLECQKQAEQVIRAAFPSHKILGEEGGEFDAGPEPFWIIDPIDGTVNFQHGLPLWCSAVAVRVGKEVVAGAVYAPMLDECYTASAGDAAKCNGEPIRVSTTARLEDALVLTGLSKHVGQNLYTLDVLREVSLKAQKTRIMGSAAVDICHVACGRADGYYEAGIYLWDIAAAGLIAQRAGARAEVLEELSNVRFRYICTNGKIHDALKDVIVRALKAGGA
ncbi:MAG: inositol monophosphatase family protein [Verrucomicrobiota bacterium]